MFFSGPDNRSRPAADRNHYPEDDLMNRTLTSRTLLLVAINLLVAACRAERDRLDVTIAEDRVFGRQYLVPSVHSSADIRPGDLEITILALGEIAECAF